MAADEKNKVKPLWPAVNLTVKDRFVSLYIKYLIMKTKELIEEIQKLPVRKRIYIIERSMRLIRKQEEGSLMRKAAEELYEDYSTDKNLTAFTNPDCE